MLTKEQIKNLKPGDPVVISTMFICVDTDGDIRFKAPSLNGSSFVHFISPKHVSLPSEHGTEVPTTKYAPTRPYQKGDRAQVVERNGRTITCFPAGRIKVGDIVTVAENENGDVFIKVLTEDGYEMMVPWFMLELITPVDELEPYSVEESCGGANLHCFILKRGEKHLSYYLYRSGNANHFYTREEAKAAAKAGCKRLNEEYRKEQK